MTVWLGLDAPTGRCRVTRPSLAVAPVAACPCLSLASTVTSMSHVLCFLLACLGGIQRRSRWHLGPSVTAITLWKGDNLFCSATVESWKEVCLTSRRGDGGRAPPF